VRIENLGWDGRVLRELDRQCYRDAEEGGDGWASAYQVGKGMGFTNGHSVAWNLRCLRMYGLVERTFISGLSLYAPTEQGGVCLLAGDTPEQSKGSDPSVPAGRGEG